MRVGCYIQFVAAAERWKITIKCKMKKIFSLKIVCCSIIASTVLFLACASGQKEGIKGAVPLESPDDIAPLMEHISGARMVLLGEASHGTLEFYRWRKEITKKLISDYGFDFVVVEGDWPAHLRLNSYVKGKEKFSDMEDLFGIFNRWPPWMWKNGTVVKLVQWLAGYNAEAVSKAGFYGMDVYGIELAYFDIIETLKSSDTEFADEILSLMQCMERYVSNMHSYARAYSQSLADCSTQIREARQLIEDNILEQLDRDDALALERNIAVLVYGEKHFRAMADSSMDNWNVRVEFMNETVEKLLEYYGPASRGIIWAHNTHIGDARATIMAQQGRINIGQLMRENLGHENVCLVGFGTGSGTVKAGSSWGARGEIMNIPEPVEDSYEYLFNKKEYDKLMFLFDETNREGKLMTPRGHRAIGVVYNPATEHLGNFVPTILPLRYDAFIYFRTTEALTEWKNE